MNEVLEKRPTDDPLARCPYCGNMPNAYRFRGEWTTYPSCFCHTKQEDMERVRNEYLKEEYHALDHSKG